MRYIRKLQEKCEAHVNCDTLILSALGTCLSSQLKPLALDKFSITLYDQLGHQLTIVSIMRKENDDKTMYRLSLHTDAQRVGKSADAGNGHSASSA